MDPKTMGAIMAAIGAGKGLLVDQPRAARQNELNAAIMQYSPWTHMTPDTNLQSVDPVGMGMQGFVGGYNQGQKMKEYQDRQDALAQLSDYDRATALLRSSSTPGGNVTVNSYGAPAPTQQPAQSSPWHLLPSLNLLG